MNELKEGVRVGYEAKRTACSAWGSEMWSRPLNSDKLAPIIHALELQRYVWLFQAHELLQACERPKSTQQEEEKASWLYDCTSSD